MPNLTSLIRHLEQERSTLQSQLGCLNTAISALTKSGSTRGTRTMSAAARQRIVAAQKARWAKWRRESRG